MRIVVRGESFELLPERCLFWPRPRLLVIADCHFGKAETFQQHGLWLPAAPVRQDLTVLSALTKRLSVERILFLGDLVHSLAGVTEDLVCDFATWLNAYPGDVQVVIGNHDVGLVKRWPAAWNSAKLSERVRVGKFLFQHKPCEGLSNDRTFQWAGHVHPVMSLVRGPDRLRLPAFVISDSQGLLPAFSRLAGGFEVSPSAHDRVFVVGKQDVYEV
ncbi:MAG: ligase-associated DNA damage response endonuclease PdeM [Nitrospirales bacterium]